MNITVSKSPKIVEQMDKLNHPEGTNATLMCSIGSGELDELKYEWLKDDKRIVPSNRVKISIAQDNFNSILRIMDLKTDDSALYTCVAKNPFGQDKISTKLFVKGEFYDYNWRLPAATLVLTHRQPAVQLKWANEPQSIQVSAGKPLRVPCLAHGQPEPRMEWRRVDSGPGGGHLIGSDLYFDSVKPADAGEYECRATNGVEKDLVSRIKMDVLGK